MSETSEEYAKRIAEVIIKSRQNLKINDAELQRKSKAVEQSKQEPDVFNEMLKAYDQPAVNLTKAAQPKTPNEAIDVMLKAYGV